MSCFRKQVDGRVGPCLNKLLLVGKGENAPVSFLGHFGYFFGLRSWNGPTFFSFSEHFGCFFVQTSYRFFSTLLGASFKLLRLSRIQWKIQGFPLKWLHRHQLDAFNHFILEFGRNICYTISYDSRQNKFNTSCTKIRNIFTKCWSNSLLKKSEFCRNSHREWLYFLSMDRKDGINFKLHIDTSFMKKRSRRVR